MERKKMTIQPIRLIIADDSARTRDALRALIATWPDIELVGEATNGQDAIRLVGELHPSVVVMDLEMPQMSGVQATRLIKESWPSVNVIVVTMSASQRNAAMDAGADGFVMKGDSPGKLLSAVRSVSDSHNAGQALERQSEEVHLGRSEGE
jgi:DNA-binding NarL/FixJ family response regulator